MGIRVEDWNGALVITGRGSLNAEKLSRYTDKQNGIASHNNRGTGWEEATSNKERVGRHIS